MSYSDFIYEITKHLADRFPSKHLGSVNIYDDDGDESTHDMYVVIGLAQLTLLAVL